MDNFRMTPVEGARRHVRCCLCGEGDQCWDRIAGQAYCPTCEESLALGEGPPLVVRTEKNVCAVCGQVGTVCFLTFPLEVSATVEIDLCPFHLRALLGRRLEPEDFQMLRQGILSLGLLADDIFLLHGAFYDCQGQALHPAGEPESDDGMTGSAPV
jgi:hypothetical protein